MVMMLHCSRGFRLWDIMLCSCPRAVASSVTLWGFSMSCSSAARRVGFDRFVKNLWQICVSPFFVFVATLYFV